MEPEAFAWFQAVDADGSGHISVQELKQALLNSNWTAFDDDTCLLMISEQPPGALGELGELGAPAHGPALLLTTLFFFFLLPRHV